MSEPTDILGKLGQKVGQTIKAHTGDGTNPHGVTKTQVSLGNVENIALSTWLGSAQIEKVGTLTEGTIPWSLINGGPDLASSTGVDGDFTIGGNLTVSGDTTTVNTQTVVVEDNIIEVNLKADGGETAQTGGIEINRGQTTVTTVDPGQPFSQGSMDFRIGLFDQQDSPPFSMVFSSVTVKPEILTPSGTEYTPVARGVYTADYLATMHNVSDNYPVQGRTYTVKEGDSMNWDVQGAFYIVKTDGTVAHSGSGLWTVPDDGAGSYVFSASTDGSSPSGGITVLQAYSSAELAPVSVTGDITFTQGPDENGFPSYIGSFSDTSYPHLRYKLSFQDEFPISGGPTVAGWLISESTDSGTNYTETENFLFSYDKSEQSDSSASFEQIAGPSGYNPIEEWIGEPTINAMINNSPEGLSVSRNIMGSDAVPNIEPSYSNSTFIDDGSGSNITAVNAYVEVNGSSIEVTNNLNNNGGSFGDPSQGAGGSGSMSISDIYDVSKQDGSEDDVDALADKLISEVNDDYTMWNASRKSSIVTALQTLSTTAGDIVGYFDILFGTPNSDSSPAGIVVKIDTAPSGTASEFRNSFKFYAVYPDDEGAWSTSEFVTIDTESKAVPAFGSVDQVTFFNSSNTSQTFSATTSARGGGGTYGDFSADWGSIAYTPNTASTSSTTSTTTNNDKAKVIWDNSQEKFILKLGNDKADLVVDKLYSRNVFPALEDLPDADTYHGMVAHVHATGQLYYAHADAWHELISVNGGQTINGNISATVFKAPDGAGITINDVALGNYSTFESAFNTAIT